jgi:arginyl-tRNA synthetase
MSIVSQIRPLVIKAVKELYQYELKENEVTINLTKPEFEGDYTIVLFSFVKSLKKAPEQLGKSLENFFHLIIQLFSALIMLLKAF